jgi:fructokinase
MMMQPDTGGPGLRLGIDLGGTKIAGVVLGRQDEVLAERRIAAPRGDYAATIAAIAGLVGALESASGARASVGIGMPGSLSPRTGLVQNANSVWLNGKPFRRDVEAAIGRSVRVANDANCFALSEATDGAGVGALSLFAVIIGTGCGGGFVFGGRLVDGPRGIGGEWGHNPLPWASGEEHPGPKCWCGKNGCMETWVSGTGLGDDHLRVAGVRLTAEAIEARARAGEAAARASLDRHASRLARGLAAMINVFDPEVITLGGGLSLMPHLYRELPPLIVPHLFADTREVLIRPPRWGDASGVRGAARLWE